MHVFDELRCGLGLRKHNRSQKRRRDNGASLFFPSTKGWRDLAPPKTLSAWTRGPILVLEALVGASANSLNPLHFEPGANACSEAAEAQLKLLHTTTLAEGGLLPTARVIAAERGREEIEPADLADAASRVATWAVSLPGLEAIEDRLAAAAAVMAGLLIEARASDDCPHRQGIVKAITDLIAELNDGWPPGITMGGRRIARLVEAILCLPKENLMPYAENTVWSSSTSALTLAESRLRRAARALLATQGGLLPTARNLAAERGGCGSDGSGGTIEPADLIAAGAMVPLLTEPAVPETITPEGVAVAARMLAGWLRDARAQDESCTSFCAACGFALPCPWGC